jgi:ribosomal protein S18 acetylase RimI-like enzyme
MSSDVVIRPGTPSDVHAVAKLLFDLAVSQGSGEALCVDAEALLRDAFTERPRVHLLIAESAQQIAAAALYFFNYSTWFSTRGLYLEDLFVLPAYRRRGVGRAMMRELARIARDEKCGRFQWLVLRSNETAIRFYEALGAKLIDDWAPMMIYADGIQKLAE